MCSRAALDAPARVEILSGSPGLSPVEMRILVIEDERQLAGHITRALSRHGHCLSAAYDGVEGLQTALNDTPDLVLLDLNLPGLDGLSVLSRLREAQSPSRVLILTARGEIEQRVKGLLVGVLRGGEVIDVPKRDPVGLALRSGDEVQLGKAAIRVRIGE